MGNPNTAQQAILNKIATSSGLTQQELTAFADFITYAVQEAQKPFKRIDLSIGAYNKKSIFINLESGVVFRFVYNNSPNYQPSLDVTIDNVKTAKGIYANQILDFIKEKTASTTATTNDFIPSHTVYKEDEMFDEGDN